MPDAQGRLEILQIHTNKMARNGALSDDVDLKELATVTKYFSGADIAGNFFFWTFSFVFSP